MQELWQIQLQEAFKKPHDLLDYLGLNAQNYPYQGPSQPWNQNFKTLVPRIFADKMQAGNPLDPLLRQVLPLPDEDLDPPHLQLSPNPLTESQFNPVPGILHKYAHRALVIITGACAVHCRYCFRKTFPYAQEQWSKNAQGVLEYIRNNTELKEIILSGGDPLSLRTETLAAILEPIAAIPHVGTIRFHTRFPIVIPSRLNQNLLALFQNLQATRPDLKFVMVLHSNHAQELCSELKNNILNFKQRTNLTFLNQSVLLKSINNHADTLIALSEKLFETSILPYYLHMPDSIIGTAHFQVTDTEALELMQALRAALPGYLVPKLVRELPGQASKYPLV
ncbi:MAG: EF-P beta-lysylation protein EpmB [Gammaproteobacteria bacterium]